MIYLYAPKIPERPSAEGFYCPARARAPAREAQRDFPCPHESSCTSCNLLGQKALAGFLRTSYPRSRSANSAKNRLGVCKTPILLSQNRGSCGLYKTSRPTPSGPAPPSHRHASGVTVGVIKIGLSPFGDRGSFTSSLLLIPSSLPPLKNLIIKPPPAQGSHLLRHIPTPPLASSKVYNLSISKGDRP